MSGPFLTSERLEYWLPRAEDLADQVALLAPDAMRRYLGPALPTHQDQFERLMRNAGRWQLYGYGTATLRLRGQDRIIGNCGVFHSWRGFGKGLDDVPEAGWIIHNDHWGKGIAQEAMHAALAWFDATHGPRRVAAMIEAGNTASERVASALGFVEYGRQIFEDSPLILYERLPG